MAGSRASGKYLTHKYASWFGCTLEEVAVIVLIYFVFDLLISAILALWLGKFFLLFLGLFVISFFLIKLTAYRIGKIKEGRQEGFLMLQIRLLCADKFGASIPFLRRCGQWITRRRL